MKLTVKALVIRLKGYLRPVAGIFALGLIFTALVSATEAAVPLFMKTMLNDGFAPDAPSSAWWRISLVFVALAVVRAIAQFASGYLTGYASNTILVQIRKDMFERVVSAKASFFQRETASSVINAVVYEVNQLLSIFTSVLFSSVQNLLTAIGYLAGLFYLNWRLTLIIAAVFPCIGWLAAQVNRRLRRLGREQQTMTSGLSYIVEEVVSGYKVVKIHGGEQYEVDRFMAMNRRLKGYAIRMIVSSGLAQSTTQLLASTAIGIVIAISLFQSLHGQGSAGSFVAYITATLLAINPLKQLMSVNQTLQRGMSAAELIFKLIDEPPEQVPGRRHLDQTSGEVEFQNVSFGYADAERAALDRISFSVKPGQMIAFVGPSGGGKTTLVNLLPRFFDPTGGTILLDGVPYVDYDVHDLRSQMAMVSQDVILFNDSIAANVAYGQTPDRERVEAALRAANLWSTVADMPLGIDTLVGDNGARLSGGQRQRLSIARAIYKDAPILILDEATSALDSESEHHVQVALDTLMKGRTVFVIAHRLSTIERADRILVLEHGRLTEEGSHAELLEKNGLYAQLHRIQYQHA
ncbi:MULTISPECIES: lipid A export permease/ATP-binding protein MsbA [Paraburkholderia]|uniref:lipid A export permease/ATP-binding protein MsbA n=1 Tax=Paraburkholderia TaxID=1822464 RepID=UPI002256F8A4|nr:MULTISPECIES: lipid A export permease/ATP-binding protein MsbA [Paraburkholderia]MCX4164953.1 lipid A export permease/ATP-binding protein MsbA [Paraburkholderia megapolitana]MDN7160446.1 lipid A export permease/ATP-binding protein MsbA [Paraburkholderia sp. CHISQ3]MDQ6497493.1 lipid A export permease/ATP-binding protein MsbA [Paraburkholderia megapolitana]